MSSNSAAIAGFVDTLRRVHELRSRTAEPPDLIAELGRCADMLDLCARLLDPGYPEASQRATAIARTARAKAALAMGVR